MSAKQSLSLKTKLLVKVSRPCGWILGPLIFLFGFLYSEALYSTAAILELVLLSFPFCVFLYGINDIYDYKSDRINPRKGSFEGIKLRPEHYTFVKRISFIFALLLATSSILSWNLSNFIGISLLLFFSFQYSAPPLRLKEKPPLDSFSNGILYFYAPFLMGFSFGGHILMLPPKIYFVTLATMGIHSLSTIMDYTV